MAIRSKGRIFTGRHCAGWTIKYPTIGTDMRYEATSVVRPGEVHRFDRCWQAEAWCEAHDVTAEEMRLVLGQGAA